MPPRKKYWHQPYDLALKNLFSHPIMIEHLLKGFVPESWIKKLDFSSLCKVSVKHHTEDLRERESDTIWRINFEDQTVYFIFLLEFQSRIEKFMAARILQYGGLIYDDLLKDQQHHLVNGYLPPIFPLVLYTGNKEWDAPLTLKQCLSPAIPLGLKRFQANIEYMVIDVGNLPREQYIDMDDNLVSFIISFENLRNTTESTDLVNRLVSRLKDKKFDRIRRDFLVYIKRALKLQEKFPDTQFNELEEVGQMLLERMEQWEKNIRQEGHQEGRQEGRQEGQLNMLLKIMGKKYSISEQVKNHLEKLSDEKLMQCLDKILDNKPIEEIMDV